MIKKVAGTILVIFALFVVLSPSEALRINDTILRVCVLKGAKELSLTIKGHYKILALKTNEVMDKGNNLKRAEVLPSQSGLLISNRAFNVYGIKIVPRRDASVYIGKRAFRGNLDIIRTKEKKLLAINHVDLEDYLKGVLYHEVSHWWPIETLKAQAIAARTYALYQKSIRQDKDFDLTNDIYSQVYGGRQSERMKTNKAIKLTRGKVLTFKGDIFPTYYHATCGGYTEDASNLWNINLNSLKGRRCDFCKHSPHYKWRYKIAISEVERKLGLAGYSVTGLKGIRLHGKTSSGRVRELRLISDKELLIPAKNFRLIIGPNLMRSTNFKLKTKGNNFLFYGLGWGHGVGMCQWGAFFLGLKRYKADHILRYYYPGTRIVRI